MQGGWSEGQACKGWQGSGLGLPPRGYCQCWGVGRVQVRRHASDRWGALLHQLPVMHCKSMSVMSHTRTHCKGPTCISVHTINAAEVALQDLWSPVTMLVFVAPATDEVCCTCCKLRTMVAAACYDATHHDLVALSRQLSQSCSMSHRTCVLAVKN